MDGGRSRLCNRASTAFERSSRRVHLCPLPSPIFRHHSQTYPEPERLPPPERRLSLTASTTRRLVFLWLLGLLILLATPARGQSWYGQRAKSEGRDPALVPGMITIDWAIWSAGCTPPPPSTKKCSVTIWTGSRSCNSRCELFIDSIRIESTSERVCGAADFFEAVISLAILNMPTTFDTVVCLPQVDSCTSVVRARMASCMTNYDGMLLPRDGAACCFVDYQVCKNPFGSPNVIPIRATPSTPPLS